MATRRFCDICQREIRNDEANYSISFNHFSQPNFNVQVQDACNVCFIALSEKIKQLKELKK